MEKSKIFPSVSQDSQKRSAEIQKQKSVGHEKARNKIGETNTGETVPQYQAKGVRFYSQKYTGSKIPFLPEFMRRTGKSDGESYGRLRSLTELKPIIGSSTPRKRFSYQVMSEPAQSGNIYTVREYRRRSYSSPPDNEQKNEPNISRRNSTLSLFSDRPRSNIPVMIRNNNVRLRKYSCPEFHLAKRNDSMEQELNTKRYSGARTATNVSNNTSQQLTREYSNQTVCETILSEQNDAKRKTIWDSKRKSSKGGNEVHSYGNPATDFHSNEICSDQREQMSSSSSNERHKGLEFDFYEDESWQSYSLEVKPPKQNVPSSMYSSRSNMLEWLGEVNRNNPQLWD